MADTVDSGIHLPGQNIAELLSQYEAGRLNFSGIDLSQADLQGVHLRGIDLSYADLSQANLQEANLRGTDLSYADLSQVNLREADLRGTLLIATNLRQADLTAAQLDGAAYDRNTHFPANFDPQQAGMNLESSSR